MTEKKKHAKQNNESKELPVSRFRHWWSYLWRTGLKFSFVALVALAAYTIYLDAKIQQKFEGQRWQVPIQIYSQLVSLSVNDEFSITELKNRLKATGYKPVNRVSRPGHFSQYKQSLTIYRRAFDFPSGPEAAKNIVISFSRGKVSSIKEGNQTVSQFHLDPVLLDRSVSEEKEDRVITALQDMPDSLLDTLILVEDRDFYFHYGVSITGIARAFVQNIRAGRTVQGGSTLTQQLAKNMFLTRQKTLWRKANEAIMALLLEFRYSKDQILEAYLNEVYVGQHYANGVYGFGLAARFYFGRDISDLTPAQIALLVGQVKGPSYYDPWRFPERAKERRDLVLRLMTEHGVLDKEGYENAVSSPLSIRKDRRMIRKKYPAFLQVVKSEIRALFNQDEMHKDIRVFTSFSPFVQQQTEQAVKQQLSLLEQQDKVDSLQAAVVVTDVSTGQIRAVVGDRVANQSGFNRAISAKRNIGSLIKPVIYVGALERYEQYNLATPLEDKPLTLESDAGQAWSPKNYDGKFRDQVTLQQALVQSLNIPTVNLGLSLGLDITANTLSVMGIELEQPLRPSMLLGALEMSPIAVNQLYLTFAKQGAFQKLSSIESVVTSQGETLYVSNQIGEQRLSAQGAYLINYAMQQVTTSGTAASLNWRLPNRRVAGKTGTTNNLRDSWFVGYDQQYLITSWIGRDDNKSSGLTGSRGALPLYANIAKRLDHKNLEVKMPEGVHLAHFDKTTGNVMSEACEGSLSYPVITASIVDTFDCEQPPEEKKKWWQRLFGDD